MIDKRKLIASEFQTCSAVCMITGISYNITEPKTISGYAFEHFHPLASLREAQAFAKLSSREHFTCSNTILAGAILTLLAESKLREDKLSSREANIYLASQNTQALTSCLHFLTSVSSRILKKIPHIAISEDFELESWLWACRTLISSPIESPKATVENYSTASQKRVKASKHSNIIVASIEPATRIQVRELLSSLKEIVAPNLYSILRISQSGNSLATMGDALRENLIKALNSYELPEAKQLALLLKKIASNASVQESITRKQLDSFEAIPSAEGPKLSIKERLALKISGKTIEEKKEFATISAEDSIEAEFTSVEALKNFKPKNSISALILELAEEVEAENQALTEFLAEEEDEIEELDFEAEDDAEGEYSSTAIASNDSSNTDSYTDSELPE